jgi:haloacid dehalogenase-like hydrolase
MEPHGETLFMKHFLKNIPFPLFVILTFLLVCTSSIRADTRTDPLPSWNEGSAKQSIVSFVDLVTKEGGENYAPPAERIAVFDNDGTLWAEKPISVQFAFALDRVRALAPKHPEWKEKQPFKAVLDGDLKSVLAGGGQTILQLVMATQTGMTVAEFEQIVSDWIGSARNPVTKRLYTEMVYQPMLELLAYLRSNGFKTYIVSGGGIDFMRPWTEKVYGIPPGQVVGSCIKVKYEMLKNGPVLMRLPEMEFIDDKDGKPVGINMFIGRQPILAFGNSDGDLQMLQWTAAGSGSRFMGLVHHTDAEREWAYDRNVSLGHLDKALTEAEEKGWTVVNMKQDWKVIFPIQRKQKNLE